MSRLQARPVKLTFTVTQPHIRLNEMSFPKNMKGLVLPLIIYVRYVKTEKSCYDWQQK